MGTRTAWVASKAENSAYALEPENIIAVCVTGPNPEVDAKSYAYDFVKAEDESAYLYKVTIEPRLKYRVHKEVVAFDHSL